MFVAMELDIQKFLRVENASKMVSGNEGKIVSSLLANEDVQFYWCMVSCEVPEDLAKQVLKLIAELWTTIRGFSFAKSYMEIYKQKIKSSPQEPLFRRHIVLDTVIHHFVCVHICIHVQIACYYLFKDIHV